MVGFNTRVRELTPPPIKSRKQVVGVDYIMLHTTVEADVFV